MKKIGLFVFLFAQFFTAWAQLGLPIQRSLLPKKSLVVDYDFSKSSSFTRGTTTVTNIASTASGNANLVSSPIYFNSLGFVSFNGSSQYLATPDLRTYFKSVNTSVQKSFTMSMWVYPTQINGVIVSELNSQTPGSGWHATNIEIINGSIHFRIWSSTAVVSLSTVNLNQWYHLAMVYDGVKLNAYINGVLQGTQISEREIPTSYQHYALGAPEITNMGSGGGYGGFHLAQFKLYQLPLSGSDILQEYDLRKNEFDYTIHSPSTNTNPTYWNVSSAWNSSTGGNGASDAFAAGHYNPWLNSSLGWAAQANNTSQFITLNYEEPCFINGVVIQPRASAGGQWVKTANIETSLNGVDFTRQFTNAVINTNTNDDNYIKFANPIFAKYVKVIPADWNNHITMRMGILVRPNDIVKDGLVLHLDPSNSRSYGGSGSTWSDLSASNNHATLTVTPTYNGSNGLVFNGTTHYGSIPSVSGVTDFTNTQKYSIEVWFRPSNGQVNSGEAELLEKWNKNNESRYPFTIRYNEGASSMSVACYDGTTYKYVTVTGFPVNTWKQLVGVFDFVGKTLTVYRDGVSVGSASLVGINQVSNTSPIAIATRLTSTGGPQTGIMFKGTIGKIRIYNKVLTSSEILKNFNANKVLYGL